MGLSDFIKGKMRKQSSPSEILRRYGELLEKFPAAILDTWMLPVPKMEMKKLLKLAWASQENNLQLRNHIEGAFIFLSNFHEGVGASPILDPISNNRPPKDPKILEQWMNSKQGIAFEKQMDEWGDWHKKRISEAEELLLEVQTWRKDA